MDELIQQLNELRIERENTSREYQSALSVSDRREREILASIRSANEQQQRAADQTNNNLRNNRCNHLRVGETVRITNNHKGKYGSVGKITRISGRMVDIKDSNNNNHTRAWWNLERFIAGDSAQ